MTDVELDRVSVAYGTGRSRVKVVDAVSLRAPTGTTFGLVGESGSGKSTLARAMVGMTPISGGAIRLDGIEISGVQTRASRLRARTVQMIFQDPYASLNPRMPIGEALGEAVKSSRSIAGAAIDREVRQLLEMVALDESAIHRRPGQFSGGQRQRIAIARALAARPSVVVADEITSSLDVSVQASVLNLIREIQRSSGFTMIFISHNLAVVRYVSDLIGVMHLGRLVETQPAQRLFASPAHPYTRVLLDSVPSLVRSVSTSGQIGGGEALEIHNPPTGCRFHPRCPVGPLADADRQVCVESDPRQRAGAASGIDVACHFPLNR